MAQYWTRTTVRARGWSDALIKDVLGEPDLRTDLEHSWGKSPASLFAIARVCDAERTEHVRTQTEKLLKQRGHWRARALEARPQAGTLLEHGHSPSDFDTSLEWVASVAWPLGNGRQAHNVLDEGARRRWIGERRAYRITHIDAFKEEFGAVTVSMRTEHLGYVNARWTGTPTRRAAWLVLTEARAGHAEADIYAPAGGRNPLATRPARAARRHWSPPDAQRVEALCLKLKPDFDQRVAHARAQKKGAKAAALALIKEHTDADDTTTRAIACVVGWTEDAVEDTVDAVITEQLIRSAENEAARAVRTIALRDTRADRHGTPYAPGERALIESAGARDAMYLDAVARALRRRPERITTMARAAARRTERLKEENEAKEREAKREAERQHRKALAQRVRDLKAIAIPADTEEETADMPPDRMTIHDLAERGWTRDAVERLLGPPRARSADSKNPKRLWWADDVEVQEGTTRFDELCQRLTNTAPTRVHWTRTQIVERGWTDDNIDTELGALKLEEQTEDTWRAADVWAREQRAPMFERLAPQREAAAQARARKREAQTRAAAERAAQWAAHDAQRRAAEQIAAIPIPKGTPLESAHTPPDLVNAPALAARGWTAAAAKALLGAPVAWRHTSHAETMGKRWWHKTSKRERKSTGRTALWHADQVETAEAEERFVALGGQRTTGPIPRTQWSAPELRRIGWSADAIDALPAQTRVANEARPGVRLWDAAAAWRAAASIDGAPRIRTQAAPGGAPARKTRAHGGAHVEHEVKRTARVTHAQAHRPVRTDMRDLEWRAVDPTTNGIADDAVAIESLAPGRYRVYVAIADTGQVLCAGSDHDVEARSRAMEYMVPGTETPLFGRNIQDARGPRGLSLDTGHTRGALVTTLEVDASGCRGIAMMEPATIAVRTRSTYAEASREEAHGRGPWGAWRAVATAIEIDRQRAGALLLGPRRRAVWDGHGVHTAGTHNAESWAGAIMVATNAVCGAWLAREGAVGLWREHRGRWPQNVHLHARPNSTRQAWRWQVRVEAASQPARYVANPHAPHASLGLVSYAHTTSPLRRYADVLMQRAAYAIRDGTTPGEVAEETRAHLNERTMLTRKHEAYLLRTHAANAAGITAGAPMTGLVTQREGDTVWVALVDAPAVWSKLDASNRPFDIGDEVRIALKRNDPSSGMTELEWLDAPSDAPNGKTGR